MARLAPLKAPFPPEAGVVLEKMTFGMPTPLALFRTIAHNPRVLDRIRMGGLLDKGSLSLRQRELMILRTCALCEAEYEWGVHVKIFQPPTGMSDAQIAATVHGKADDALWREDEGAILALADALHARSRIDDALYARLEKASARNRSSSWWCWPASTTRFRSRSAPSRSRMRRTPRLSRHFRGVAHACLQAPRGISD